MAQSSDDLRTRLLRLGRAAKAGDQAADDAREARDRAIHDADAAGWSLLQIADVVGIDPSSVLRAIVREQGRRQLIDLKGDEPR